jgi:hypothetical protein
VGAGTPLGKLRYESLLNWARRNQRTVEHAPEKWGAGIVTTAILLLMLANGGRIARAIRTGRLQAHPERSPDEAAAMWYERMARHLARRGMRKSATQTPKEFVRVIQNEKLRTTVEQFTDAYESARFGKSSEDALRLREMYEEVELAAKR